MATFSWLFNFIVLLWWTVWTSDFMLTFSWLFVMLWWKTLFVYSQFFLLLQARPLLTRALEDGNYDSLVDARLQRQYNNNEMARMVACAAACVRHSARRRPRMSQVISLPCKTLRVYLKQVAPLFYASYNWGIRMEPTSSGSSWYKLFFGEGFSGHEFRVVA